jgi:fused signal recognition particle receptor
MDDEKKWSGDEPQKDTAPPEATKPSVRYEENDNWEFEAQAPTLDDNFLADDQFEIQMPAEKPRPVESAPAAPAANSGEKQVTVRTAPLKIALFCLLFAAVVAVLAVLGVRYYTVPNGKEGEMLNPGGTALTVGETKVSLGAYNYYYSRIVQNYLNYANYGYYDLDSTKDYSKQYVTNSDGEKITWLQMFKDKTVDQIQYVTSYYEAGQAAGITLTADQKKSIKEQMKVEETAYRFENEKSVVLVIGVNGVGKTTTVGKLAGKLKEQGKKVVIAGADTFRAAAGDQLKEWANRAGVDMIGGAEGADPGAVVYDAVAASKARNADVLLVDTAGRLHNKKNLMNELGKINKILESEYPDAYRETLVVLDATTGQNALVQAREFSDVAKISGIVLTKMDGTAKGGIAVAIQSELSVPVKYIGVGETIDDLQKFDSDEFVNALFDTKTE